MQLSKCTHCRLSQHRNNVVSSNDVFASRGLWVVAGHPGLLEDISGKPFRVAEERALLEHWLQYIGCSYDKVRVSYALKCKPPEDEIISQKYSGVDANQTEEVRTCHNWMYKEIKYFQPRLVLLLGQLAFSAYTGFGEHIKRVVGSKVFWDNRYKNFFITSYDPKFFLKLERSLEAKFLKIVHRQQEQTLKNANIIYTELLKGYYTQPEFISKQSAEIQTILKLQQAGVKLEYFPNLPF